MSMPENPLNGTEQGGPGGETHRSVDLSPIPESQRIRSFGLFAAARADTPELVRELKEKIDLRPQEVAAEDIKWENEPRYDPVLEQDSLGERRSYWEAKGKGYDEAMGIWKSEFKRLVNEVGEKENEEEFKYKAEAVKSIMPKSPEGTTGLREKSLTEITENDAEALFQIYSADNHSKIDEFINNAIESSTSEEGEVNLDELNARRDGLRWIATGFFGEKTAQDVANQIILEAQVRQRRTEARRVIEEELQPRAYEEIPPAPVGTTPQPAPTRENDEEQAIETDPQTDDEELRRTAPVHPQSSRIGESTTGVHPQSSREEPRGATGSQRDEETSPEESDDSSQEHTGEKHMPDVPSLMRAHERALRESNASLEDKKAFNPSYQPREDEIAQDTQATTEGGPRQAEENGSQKIPAAPEKLSGSAEEQTEGEGSRRPPVHPQSPQAGEGTTGIHPQSSREESGNTTGSPDSNRVEPSASEKPSTTREQNSQGPQITEEDLRYEIDYQLLSGSMQGAEGVSPKIDNTAITRGQVGRLLDRINLNAAFENPNSTEGMVKSVEEHIQEIERRDHELNDKEKSEIEAAGLLKEFLANAEYGFKEKALETIRKASEEQNQHSIVDSRQNLEGSLVHENQSLGNVASSFFELSEMMYMSKHEGKRYQSEEAKRKLQEAIDKNKDINVT